MNLYNIYTEAELVKSERDQLPDSSFGLPKTRQYPLHDAEHVRKAIQMFSHCPEKNRKELANNIFLAAKKFSVEISEKALVYKYLTSKQQKEISAQNEHSKKVSEANPMMAFVEFYQFPLTEDNIEKYRNDYTRLNALSDLPYKKGLLLIDKNDQVGGFIQVDTRTNILRNLEVNPIYRGHGIGSKLLNTEVGKLASTVILPNEDTKLLSFFRENGFTGSNSLLKRNNGKLSEDTVNNNIVSEQLQSAMERLATNKDIVNEMSNYLDYLREASVAGIASVAPLAGATIRQPFSVTDSIRKATINCPNMFDYDEFFEVEESKFMCSSEENSLDVTEPVDVAKNIDDRDKNSSSRIKKPQSMMSEDIDFSARADAKMVDYKDQSSDVIVGIDRYTCHKDKYGCYYIALNANEHEDKTRKLQILPYLNEDMYISSDFHINHKNRNSANFTNLLVSEINSKVPISGTFLFCGDLGNKALLQKDVISSFISKLNVSRKILLLGNHDNLSLQDYYDMGFTFVTDIIETEKYIFSHCPVNPRDKINVHGHIHGEKEYWNMPAERHINVYISSHDNKIYQLKDYLKFYKQGKYKGKSVRKTFDR